MGRTEPTVVMPPNPNRRAERARRAKDTVNKVIPDMLRASPRARHGIHKADLIVDPPVSVSTPQSGVTIAATDAHPRIRLQCTDTLTAAARVAERPFALKRTASSSRAQHNANVTVLNMASPLRPGGGFLDGANSQEEFLCARTTLYPSLWDSFYRLPEIGGVHTPDVLVFRDSTPEANELVKRDRYFVDVITAAMLRFPEVRGRTDERDASCSCGVSYCDRDRELVTRKMKAVMRMAQSKGCEKLVLGAWGCGAYGNPVKEVAKIWRKVLAGSPRQRRPNAERWEGIKEVVFAIPDRTMLREFERAFDGVLSYDPISPAEEADSGAEVPISIDDTSTAELISKIAETEMQIEQIQNPRSKARLREVLGGLNKELAQGLANKAAQDQDLTLQEDEEVDEFVVSGFPASDDEENMYNYDEDDVASDSSDGAMSSNEVYEFRPPPPGFDSQTSMDEESQDESVYNVFPPSPNFNPRTGWFTGSMEQLTRMLRSSSPIRKTSHVSPGSPVLRPDSSGQEIDEATITKYLSKYEGTDAMT